ncbi:hypothetical protein M8C21_006640 [Ambrosia artemisiifolia]|uniref:ABC transporter domain-containing protein n=1 Tax=Ambrosia artemisiifolia TaxID=4212 RepID=A0AAD5CXH1_AMBAR|nr:hypothetical protein M8C21_006640 [Ambrosia artemisiifolia]
MDSRCHDEIEDLSNSSPPPTSNNGIVRNFDISSQTYHRSRSSSQIDIQEDSCCSIKDRPLPIFLKFEDVEFKVKLSKATPGNPVKAVVSKVAAHTNSEQDNYKQILKGITGSIGPGEILALMGPSGSGKTTLLKVIGGRLRDNIKGSVTYNDVPYSPALKRRIGFVTQDDVLYPQLTVEETLVFAAFLRLSGSMSQKQKYERVEVILKELGLERLEFLLDLATGQVNDITAPDDIVTPRGTWDYERAVIRYVQHRYRIELEIKEKDANHRNSGKVPEQLRLAIQVKKDWTISWWDQFLILFKRTYRERWRDYFDILRIIQSLGVALLLGLLWWKSSYVTEAHLRDQIGLLFYVCIFWTSSSIFGAVYVFPFEKFTLVKERKADMYRLSAFYVCSTLCDMIAHVTYPTIFMSILYFMVGFQKTVQCFFLTLLVVLLIAITSQGAGEMLGAAVMSVRRAGNVASLILMLFLLTGGYYVQNIPEFMRWLKYISFMYHGFRLLLKVQYTGDELYECESIGGCRPLQSSPSFYTVNLKGGWKEVWILLGMGVVYRLLAYICLRRQISKCNI